MTNDERNLKLTETGAENPVTVLAFFRPFGFRHSFGIRHL